MNSDEEMQDQEIEEEEYRQEPHLTVLQAIGLMVLLLILQLLFSLGFSKLQGAISEETNWLHIAITHALSGLLTAKAGAILAGLSIMAMLMPRKLNGWMILPLLVASSGVTILASELGNVMHRISPIPKEYLDLVNQLFQQNLAGVLISLAVIAPVVEEMIFRGIILEGLRVRYTLTTAVFVSALLFGLVHVVPWAILNAFLLGLFFAWLKLETGSLLLCIVGHSLYNSFPFILNRIISIQVPGFNTMPGQTVQFQPLWFDVLGAILLVAGITGIRALRTGATEIETTDRFSGNAPL